MVTDKYGVLSSNAFSTPEIKEYIVPFVSVGSTGQDTNGPTNGPLLDENQNMLLLPTDNLIPESSELQRI